MNPPNMPGNTHPCDDQLALAAGHDQDVLGGLKTRWHLRSCADCRARVESFRRVSAKLRTNLDSVPIDLRNWDRLAAEMTGNIRVGLAAGQAVAQVYDKRDKLGWKAAVVVCSAVALLTGAWVLNIPVAKRYPGVSLAATSAGIELQQNGSSLMLLHTRTDSPVMSGSAPGELRARYSDKDTGQVIITNVYSQ